MIKQDTKINNSNFPPQRSLSLVNTYRGRTSEKTGLPYHCFRCQEGLPLSGLASLQDDMGMSQLYCGKCAGKLALEAQGHYRALQGITFHCLLRPSGIDNLGRLSFLPCVHFNRDTPPCDTCRVRCKAYWDKIDEKLLCVDGCLKCQNRFLCWTE